MSMDRDYLRSISKDMNYSNVYDDKFKDEGKSRNVVRDHRIQRKSKTPNHFCHDCCTCYRDEKPSTLGLDLNMEDKSRYVKQPQNLVMDVLKNSDSEHVDDVDINYIKLKHPELYKSFKLSLLNLLPVVVLAANLPS